MNVYIVIGTYTESTLWGEAPRADILGVFSRESLAVESIPTDSPYPYDRIEIEFHEVS